MKVDSMEIEAPNSPAVVGGGPDPKENDREEPIYIRRGRIKSIFTGRNQRRNRGRHEAASGLEELSGDVLLDCLRVVYDDCKNDGDNHVGNEFFIEKYAESVSAVQRNLISIHDFNVGTLLGNGRFGQVHLAKETKNGRVYALKIMPKSNSYVQRYISSVDNELSILALNKSPFLNALKYSFHDASNLYFVIEYCPGGDFATVLRRYSGKLTEEHARFYMAELLLGINAVHILGFAHRDIKPENMLIDRLGHVKLADFGSSTKLKNGKVVSRLPMGQSPTYVAPEVLQSLEDDSNVFDGNYGAECDWWSLGIILYQCLFGMTPFQGESDLNTFKNILGYQNYLEIPADTDISPDLKGLLLGLITDANVRLTYQDLLPHSFFNSVIWDGLQNEMPPYIPVVKSEDDSCNFSPIKPVSPLNDNKIPKYAFVGFTRTLQEYSSGLNASMNSTFNNSVTDQSAEGSFLHDERNAFIQLKAELATKDDLLVQRKNEISNLETKLEATTVIITDKDSKIVKLSSELKRIRMEKDKIGQELLEEQEYRKELEGQSQELVMSIKASQQKKQMDLQNEVKMQQQLVTSREQQLEEFKEVIKALREENLHVKSQLEKNIAATKNGENNMKANKSYRGSVSMLESRFSSATIELEGKLQQLNQKHAEELEELKQNYQEKENNWEEAIIRYKSEIGDLIGRLDESRRSREATLKELNESYIQRDRLVVSYEDHICQLQADLEELNNNFYAKEKQVVQTLESELNRTRCDKERLSIRVETLKTEASQKEDRIRDLSRIIDRLEESLRLLEKQRADTEQILAKNQILDRQEGAVQILQEQLQKAQESKEVLQESLYAEKQTLKEVQTKLSEVEKDLTITKLDLKFACKEKKELEQVLENLKLEKEEFLKNITVLEHEKSDTCALLREAEKSSEALKSSLEISEKTLAEINNLFEGLKEDMALQTANGEKLEQELADCQSKIEDYESLRLSFAQRESEMRQKDAQLEEKDCKILSLSTNVEALKEVITVLEDQLKDLDKIVANNSDDTTKFIKIKATLETEITALQDELQSVRISLNELKSLRAFDEQQLRSTSCALKAEETRRENEVLALKDKLAELKESSEETAFKLAELETEVEELSVTKTNLNDMIEVLKHENTFLKQEASRNIGQIVQLKDCNMKFKSALDEAICKGERWKVRLESTQEELLHLENEKAEIESRFESTLLQQQKLVEFLHGKCSQPKKKTLFPLPTKIFARHKEEPIEKDILQMLTSTPTSYTKTPSKNVATSTPVTTLPITNLRTPDLSPTVLSAVKKSPLKSLKLHPILEEELSQEHRLIQKRNFKADELNTLLGQQHSQQESCDMQDSESEEVRQESVFKTHVIMTESDAVKPDEKIGQIHCVKELKKDLYLIGSSEGLFSRRLNESKISTVVKIDGIGSIHQVEFIFQDNLAIFIEGENRRLISLAYGMLEACAKAAACSKPEVGFGQQHLANLDDVINFQVQKKADGGSLIAAVLEDMIVLLDWHKNCFVVRYSLTTPQRATCLLTTPKSILFACDNVYQMFFEDNSVEAFLDESDGSISCAMYPGEGDPGPVAILDVGRSNLNKGETVYAVEYLICFNDLAVFVDHCGRRSRSEDIAWTKVPTSVEYYHPNLYVTHFNCVEVLRIHPYSYTKSRVILNRNSIGKEIPTLPKSEYFDIVSPRIVGKSARHPAVIVVSEDKGLTSIVEVGMEESDCMDNNSIAFEVTSISGSSSTSLSSSPLRGSKMSLVSSNTESEVDSVKLERGISSKDTLSSGRSGILVRQGQRSGILLPSQHTLDGPPKPKRILGTCPDSSFIVDAAGDANRNKQKVHFSSGRRF